METLPTPLSDLSLRNILNEIESTTFRNGVFYSQEISAAGFLIVLDGCAYRGEKDVVHATHLQPAESTPVYDLEFTSIELVSGDYEEQFSMTDDQQEKIQVAILNDSKIDW